MLTVNQAIYRVTGKGMVATEPKTERLRRTLHLPDGVRAALKAHRVRQLQERLATGSRWRDSGLVFATGIGTPLEPRNLFRSFKAPLAKAGLPNIRFHYLRHSAASLLLAQGVPMRAVMELLGHSNIGTTADIYSHVMPRHDAGGGEEDGRHPRRAASVDYGEAKALTGRFRDSVAVKLAVKTAWMCLETRKTLDFIGAP
jgi:integrase